MHRSTMHILVVYIRLDRSNLNSSLVYFKIKLIFCTVDNFEKRVTTKKKIHNCYCKLFLTRFSVPDRAEKAFKKEK